MSKSVKRLTVGEVTMKDDEVPSIETYQLSALMRIADASEAMAANYNKMKLDKEMYERWYYEKVEKNNKLNLRIAALQGVITRMKNKQTKTDNQ